MLPATLELEIVTPERRVLAREVGEVVLPAADGYLGVRPGHAPLLAGLQIGEISYRDDTGQHYLAVSGGFAEIQRGHVLVLAETSERAEDIDPERAERARQQAERALRERHSSEEAFQRAELRLKRALVRLRVRDRLN